MTKTQRNIATALAAKANMDAAWAKAAADDRATITRRRRWKIAGTLALLVLAAAITVSAFLTSR